jgi:hypothetical protein
MRKAMIAMFTLLTRFSRLKGYFSKNWATLAKNEQIYIYSMQQLQKTK